MAESWKKLKISNVFSSFVCKNQNRSALVRELLTVLRARDLIFFTTDLQTVIQQFTARADLFLNHSVKWIIQELDKIHTI